MTVLNVDFVTETCCHKGCGLTFAFTRSFYRQVRNDGSWWCCPLGHQQHYTGASDEQKLKDAAARETALNDQLEAANRATEGGGGRVMSMVTQCLYLARVSRLPEGLDLQLRP